MNFKYYKTVPLIITLLVLSVLFKILTAWLDSFLSTHPRLKEVLDYIDCFSVVGLITITFTIINFLGWKWWAFKWLVDIPNLNGRYEGTLISSYLTPAGIQVEKRCVMEIKQSASSIHIKSYFGDINNNNLSPTSSSYSISEELELQKDGFFKLSYIFTNESEILVQLNNHLGTASFKYYNDIKKLKGEYYNQRQNNGKIEVVFVQKKLLGRLER